MKPMHLAGSSKSTEIICIAVDQRDDVTKGENSGLLSHLPSKLNSESASSVVDSSEGFTAS